MDRLFNFSVDHRLKIVIHIFRGEITTDQILAHLNEAVFSNEYRDDYNILVDLREAKLVDFYEHMDNFTNLLNSMIDKINMKRCCAFLTDKPEHVAYATLFILNLESQQTGMKFSVFSTEKAALNWLTYVYSSPPTLLRKFS